MVEGVTLQTRRPHHRPADCRRDRPRRRGAADRPSHAGDPGQGGLPRAGRRRRLSRLRGSASTTPRASATTAPAIASNCCRRGGPQEPAGVDGGRRAGGGRPRHRPGRRAHGVRPLRPGARLPHGTPALRAQGRRRRRHHHLQDGDPASVTLAGYELQDVPVAFHQENVKGAFDTKRLAGNLGAGILNRFRVLFDYAHDCLWLEPGPEFGAPLPRDRAGLNLEREDDVLVVRFVAPGSPAAAAGWREGERVRPSTASRSAPSGGASWRAGRGPRTARRRGSRWRTGASGRWRCGLTTDASVRRAPDSLVTPACCCESIAHVVVLLAMSAPLAPRIAAILARPTVAKVVVAYLFGSHATGRQHRESDVDIGVLLPWVVGEGTRERFETRHDWQACSRRSCTRERSTWSCSTTHHRPWCVASRPRAPLSTARMPRSNMHCGVTRCYGRPTSSRSWREPGA